VYRGRGCAEEGRNGWWGHREAVMAALSVSGAEDESSRIAAADGLVHCSWVGCSLLFPPSCAARVAFAVVDPVLLLVMCCSRRAAASSELAWPQPTPSPLPYQHRKTSSIPPSQRPHGKSHHPPKSPPNPPSQSSPLHPTHLSRSNHEWLCVGFRLSGQRVFCACSRRAFLHQLASTCRSPVHSMIF
jgi:hypothetical protein